LAPNFAEVKSKETRGKMSSRNGMMGLLETPPAGLPAYRPPVARTPDHEFMRAPNKRHSRLLFKIKDQEMNARWSKDGKRPMFEMLQFWSTYLEKKAQSAVKEFKRHYEFTRIDNQDFIDIATILQMIEKDAIPHKKNDPMSKAHRDAIETTLKAFLNGNSSMITNLESWTQQAASAVQDKLTDEVPPRGGVKVSSSAPMRQSCSPVQAQDDTVMNDIEPESDIEEVSTASASSALMQQVVSFCHFLTILKRCV